MKNKELRSSILLLLTAAIWGFAFVAQRIGMDYLGPFTFNAIRFALGSISLIPVIYFLGNGKNCANWMLQMMALRLKAIMVPLGTFMRIITENISI